jgi:hypothetical protein
MREQLKQMILAMALNKNLFESLKNDLLNLDPKTDVMISLLTIEQIAQMKSDLERTDELLEDLMKMRVELIDTIEKVEIFYKKLLTTE